jgi:hypothetical protein
MSDNLQNQGPTPFFQDDEDIDQENSKKFNFSSITRLLSGSMLRLKPQQLFILLLMFLVMVCLLGTVFLLVTGRMVAPFL